MKIKFRLPKIASADIAFVVDQSSSYKDDIATFKAKANELVKAFDQFGESVYYALTGFSDFPRFYDRTGDFAYRLHQALTGDKEKFIKQIKALTLYHGGDTPESQLEAIYQTVNKLQWRTGSLRIIFLATDANFHNRDWEHYYPGHGYTDTVYALLNNKITLYGLAGSGKMDDLTKLSKATGGKAYLLSANSREIVSHINKAFAALQTSGEIVLKADNSDYVESITPEKIDIGKMSAGDEVQLTVTFKEGAFENVKFSLFLQTDKEAFLEKQPVILMND